MKKVQIADVYDSINVSHGDEAWADLAADTIADTAHIERAAMLPFGTRNGSPTVNLLVRTKDGDALVHVTVTLAAWQTMSHVFQQWAMAGRVRGESE